MSDPANTIRERLWEIVGRHVEAWEEYKVASDRYVRVLDEAAAAYRAFVVALSTADREDET